MRLAMLWVPALVVAAVPSIAAAQPACDPTGRWAFKIEWASGTCVDLPDSDGVLIVVRGDDGQPKLADTEDGSGALDRRVNVRVEDGACRIKLDFDVNQTAYGAPDLAHWSYSLIDHGGIVVGSGSYTHDESGRKGGKRCTQRFSAAGARSARSEAAAAPAAPAAPPTTPIAGACGEGRSATADTAGHCCWAGQVWAPSRARCVGIPTSCPDGRHLEGEDCAAGTEAERVAALLTREVGSRRGTVEQCWKRTFTDGSGPKGYLRVRMSVQRSGQVKGAQVIEDALHSDAVAACAVQTINGWLLPSPGVDEALFEYAFTFGPPAAPAKK